MLLAGVVLWSLGTLVAPPAAKISLLALCASRVFVSETPALPGIEQKLCVVPEWQRAVKRDGYHVDLTC